MRFDPFREFDRLTESVLGAAAQLRGGDRERTVNDVYGRLAWWVRASGSAAAA